MISLGKYDPDVSHSKVQAYLTLIKKFDRNVAAKKLIADKGTVPLTPLNAGESPSVAQAKTMLKEIGFLSGSRIDGMLRARKRNCGFYSF